MLYAVFVIVAEEPKVTERVLPPVPVAKVVRFAASVSLCCEHRIYPPTTQPKVVGTVVRETEVGSGEEEEGEEEEEEEGEVAVKRQREEKKLAIMMMPKRRRRLYEKVRGDRGKVNV